jgi:hypothetical protein
MNNVLEEIYGTRDVTSWEEVFGTRKEKENCPEVDLLEAVFETAVWEYLSGPGKTNKERRIFNNAKTWIFDEPGVEDIFSFNFICEHVKKYDISWFKGGLLKADFIPTQYKKRQIKRGEGRLIPKPYRQRGYKGKMGRAA